MILAHFSETWRFRKAEWMLALIIAGLGVVYTLSPGLFDRPYFASMRGMMPQQWWALLCLFVGGMRLMFLFINGAFFASPAIRCLGSSASIGVWVALVIAAVLNDYAANSLAIWPICLVFDLIVVRETAIEWGAVERRKVSEASHARAVR